MKRRKKKATHTVIRPKRISPSDLVGIDLIVTYQGLDPRKNLMVSRALGKYETGTGMAFGTSVRDHTATVPGSKLVAVLALLKKIRGIETHRLVQKWVLCR